MNSEGSAGAISEEDDISGWNVENGAFSAQQMEIDDNLGRNGNKDGISAPEGQKQEDGNFSGRNGKNYEISALYAQQQELESAKEGTIEKIEDAAVLARAYIAKRREEINNSVRAIFAGKMASYMAVKSYNMRLLLALDLHTRWTAQASWAPGGLLLWS